MKTIDSRLWAESYMAYQSLLLSVLRRASFYAKNERGCAPRRNVPQVISRPTRRELLVSCLCNISTNDCTAASMIIFYIIYARVETTAFPDC